MCIKLAQTSINANNTCPFKKNVYIIIKKNEKPQYIVLIDIMVIYVRRKITVLYLNYLYMKIPIYSLDRITCIIIFLKCFHNINITD